MYCEVHSVKRKKLRHFLLLWACIIFVFTVFTEFLFFSNPASTPPTGKGASVI